MHLYPVLVRVKYYSRFWNKAVLLGPALKWRHSTQTSSDTKLRHTWVGVQTGVCYKQQAVKMQSVKNGLESGPHPAVGGQRSMTSRYKQLFEFIVHVSVLDWNSNAWCYSYKTSVNHSINERINLWTEWSTNQKNKNKNQWKKKETENQIKSNQIKLTAKYILKSIFKLCFSRKEIRTRYWQWATGMFMRLYTGLSKILSA